MINDTKYNVNLILPEENTVYDNLMKTEDSEFIVMGGYETAKTTMCLTKIHQCCSENKINVLIVRKTKSSLYTTVRPTYENVVLPFQIKSKESEVHAYGGRNVKRYDYINTQSQIMLTSISDIPSDEYDVIYVNECDELSHEEWEKLKEQLTENGVIFGDCNPTSTQHWIAELMISDKLKVFLTRHSDNPVLYRNGKWTQRGKTTIDKLGQLTGLHYIRGVLGLISDYDGMEFTF